MYLESITILLLLKSLALQDSTLIGSTAGGRTDALWMGPIDFYIKTDPQLIDPKDIGPAGTFLDLTGWLLSENSTEEWSRTI